MDEPRGRDVALDEAIAAADPRALAAVLTHLTGDSDAVPNPRDRAAIRALAEKVLPTFVGTRVPVPTPTDDVLDACMRLAAAEPVPESYRALVRQEMGVGPFDEPRPLHAPPGFRVVVIGAGAGGLALGLRFRELGFTEFTILERQAEVGGTWWQNRYPGCRVDTPSLVYGFGSDVDPGWPDHFSFQPTLRDYFVKHGNRIRDHIRCGVTVSRLEWDEAADEWRVQCERGDGSTFELRANLVVGATGFLNIPKHPDIPGRSSFAGAAFHSADWPSEDHVTGRRVAVIGSGASSNQIVPAIAPLAREVLVYQRSPHWITGHPIYGLPLTGVERWLIENIPTYLTWFRFRHWWSIGDRNIALMRIDPDWPHLDRSVNAASDKLRSQLTAYIEAQLADRPDLLEKVIPPFPPYAKRLIVDNGFYQALRRDNVRLLTDPIDEITPEGVVSSGRLEAVDVIVYATGFETNRVLWPVQITGAGGVDVRARLDTEPEAYRGVALADCPNLFLTTGPNGITVHGGALTFHLESIASYICETLRSMFDHGWRRVEIDPDALRAFVEHCRVENPKYVWSYDGVDNWFRGTVGSTGMAMPTTNLDVWEEGRHPDLSVYRFA